MSQSVSCLSAQDAHVKYRKRRLFGKTSEFHALKGISFDLYQGDSLGVIGRNGAGKSTLLRLLAGILDPDQGRIINSGVNVSLLALGAGVAPECTGRSNAVIQAMLQQNISLQEAEELVPKVFEFAELEDFIDVPFKFYSSGMRARLNFAVATQIQSDVLLVDEVIAVGDINFRKKSSQAMLNKMKSGDTVVLVSHSLGIIKSICNRAIWIEKGKLMLEGPAPEIVKEYQNYWGD